MFENYKNNLYFKSFIILIEKIGIEKFEYYENKDTITFSSLENKNNNFKITFIIWHATNRLSFFVFNREITDEYFNSIIQSDECFKFIDCILKHPVKRITYTSINKNKIIKEIFILKRYKANGNIIDFEEISLKKIIYPWSKLKQIEDVFSSWI